MRRAGFGRPGHTFPGAQASNQPERSVREYAIILAVIGAVIALAALTLGGAVAGALQDAQTTIETCGGSC